MIPFPVSFVTFCASALLYYQLLLNRTAYKSISRYFFADCTDTLKHLVACGITGTFYAIMHSFFPTSLSTIHLALATAIVGCIASFFLNAALIFVASSLWGVITLLTSIFTGYTHPLISFVLLACAMVCYAITYRLPRSYVRTSFLLQSISLGSIVAYLFHLNAMYNLSQYNLPFIGKIVILSSASLTLLWLLVSATLEKPYTALSSILLFLFLGLNFLYTTALYNWSFVIPSIDELSDLIIGIFSLQISLSSLVFETLYAPFSIWTIGLLLLSITTFCLSIVYKHNKHTNLQRICTLISISSYGFILFYFCLYKGFIHLQVTQAYTFLHLDKEIIGSLAPLLSSVCGLIGYTYYKKLLQPAHYYCLAGFAGLFSFFFASRLFAILSSETIIERLSNTTDVTWWGALLLIVIVTALTLMMLYPLVYKRVEPSKLIILYSIILFLLMLSWHVHFARAATPKLIKTAFYTFTLLSFVPAFEYAKKGSSRFFVLLSYISMLFVAFSFLKNPSQLYVNIAQYEWWNMTIAVTPLFLMMMICFAVYWHKKITFDYMLYLPNTLLLVSIEGVVFGYSLLHTFKWINNFSNTLLISLCLGMLLVVLMLIANSLEKQLQKKWISLAIAIICIYTLTKGQLPINNSVALLTVRSFFLGCVIIYIASYIPFLQASKKQYASGL